MLRDSVHFVDLSGLFEDERRTIFVDSCCHLNVLGNEVLAERLVDEIDTSRQDPGPHRP